MTDINLMGHKPLEAASFYTADKKKRNEITVLRYLLTGVSLVLGGVFWFRVEEKLVF